VSLAQQRIGTGDPDVLTGGPLGADAWRVVDSWRPPTAEAGRVRDEFLALLREHPTAVRADHPGAHLTASALVVHPDLSRVLLCLHRRVGAWTQLGGHCEEGDDGLAAAALREAIEESGLTGLRVHPVPIDLDIHPVTCRYGPSRHFDVRFAMLAPAGSDRVVSPESTELGWFAPDALPTPLASATDRLFSPALRAARDLR
jgi:8-oxo-dGTP pyrophosphatase MutT (NUDIX family)